MQEELISAVIITYNNERYIEDCIKSIINQTYKNLEIIIVNDGSIDNTSDIVNKYAKTDSRIKYIDRKENKGTMYTRQEGYKNCTGKYVIFIDSDDFLVKNSIKILYNKMIKNNVDIVRGEMIKYNGQKYIKIRKNINNEILINKENYEPLLYDLVCNTIYCNSMVGQLVKREYLEDINKVDVNSIYGEDLRSNLYLFDNVNTILYIPDELYVYRINEASITNTKNLEKLNIKLKETIDTYVFLFNYIKQKNTKEWTKYEILILQKIYYYIATIGIDIINNSNYRNGINILKNEKQKIKIASNSKLNKIKITDNIFYKIPMILIKNELYCILYVYIKTIFNLTNNLYAKISRRNK